MTKVLVISGVNGNGVVNFHNYNSTNNLVPIDWIGILEEENATTKYVGNNGNSFNVELYTFGDVDKDFERLIREVIQDDSEKDDLDFFVYRK